MGMGGLVFLAVYMEDLAACCLGDSVPLVPPRIQHRNIIIRCAYQYIIWDILRHLPGMRYGSLSSVAKNIFRNSST